MVTADKVVKITKRALLFGGAAVGGGLVIGYAYLREKPGTAGFESHGTPGYALNAWVKITPDNQVIVGVPRSEMGQGVYTSVAMLICEELEVEFDKVTVEYPALDGKYINGFAITDGMDAGGTVLPWLITRVVAKLKMIVTGGSSTIRGDIYTMPKAGAMAREMLIAEAADRWDVSPSECRAELGEVIHEDTGRKIVYGDLADGAARRDAPSDVPLKDPSTYRLVGKPIPRLDVPGKVTGKAEFGVDVKLPDMLYAAIKQCPYYGGALISYNEEAIAARPGVVSVVEVDNGLVVVAETYWQAKMAVDALEVVWDDGGQGNLSTDDILQDALSQLETGDAVAIIEDQKALKALEDSTGDLVEAIYTLPYLAHTCMEPMNCTVLVNGDRAEVWAGTQSPTMIAWGVAKGAKVESDAVDLHMTYMGGGFGRRIEYDYVVQAAQAARAVEGRPVKLIWSREEDVAHDVFRPLAVAHFRAKTAQDGALEAVSARVALQSVNYDFTQRTDLSFGIEGATDRASTDGLREWPYATIAYHLENLWLQYPVAVGNWRSVGHSHNAFFKESFVDELAHKAGEDPFEYRRRLLKDKPQHLAVLELAAEKAGWGTPLGAGRGRGIAVHESFDSFVAEVAEVSISARGELSVDRVVCVIDCGAVVNPDTVVAQMESGIVYGLSAVLFGEITIEDGQVVQQNFPDYDAVRLREMPEIETYILASGYQVGGAGEPSTPPLAPAVTNAIFNATGKRLRSLPLGNVDLVGV